MNDRFRHRRRAPKVRRALNLKPILIVLALLAAAALKPQAAEATRVKATFGRPDARAAMKAALKSPEVRAILRSSDGGFSLIELIVALAVASIGMAAVMITASQNRVAQAMVEAGEALAETEAATLTRLSSALTETGKGLRTEGKTRCETAYVLANLSKATGEVLKPVSSPEGAALLASVRTSPSPVVQNAVNRCLAPTNGKITKGMYLCFVGQNGPGGSTVLSEAFLGFADAANGRLAACDDVATTLENPVGFVALAIYGAAGPDWSRNGPVRYREGRYYVPAR